MITVTRSNERGHTKIGWLDSYHTFSFGDYFDPRHMGFKTLRVINEDRVAPEEGFGTHPHNDMEIITYVLEGELEHRDSMGNGSVIHPGELQVMTAGTGITHSEFNHSTDKPVHLVQIWIRPERKGLTPRYDQRTFNDKEKSGQFRLVVSSDESSGALRIHQDAKIFLAALQPGKTAAYRPSRGRGLWVQVLSGKFTLNGVELKAGDGAAISDEPSIEAKAIEAGELMLFDLA